MSAATGFGLERLFKDIRIVGREFNREIQTADLNRVVQIAARQTPPPAKGRSPSKILYGTQTGTRPPAFRFFTNHPDSIPDSYARFMEHQLRYHFGFRGVPLKLDWRGRDGVEQGAAPHERPAPKRRKPARPAGKPARRSLNKLRAVKGKTSHRASSKSRRGKDRG
jgi:GTP-binding protein